MAIEGLGKPTWVQIWFNKLQSLQQETTDCFRKTETEHKSILNRSAYRFHFAFVAVKNLYLQYYIMLYSEPSHSYQRYIQITNRSRLYEQSVYTNAVNSGYICEWFPIACHHPFYYQPYCSTTRVGSPKRKWNTSMNLALLKKVMAVGTHIQPRNKVTQRFADVADRLNNNTMLQMPWRADEKHCKDRFWRLLDNWPSLDVVIAAASDGEEEFGKYEQIWTDIKDQIDGREEEIVEITANAVQEMIGLWLVVRLLDILTWIGILLEPHRKLFTTPMMMRVRRKPYGGFKVSSNATWPSRSMPWIRERITG